MPTHPFPPCHFPVENFFQVSPEPQGEVQTISSGTQDSHLSDLISVSPSAAALNCAFHLHSAPHSASPSSVSPCPVHPLIPCSELTGFFVLTISYHYSFMAAQSLLLTILFRKASKVLCLSMLPLRQDPKIDSSLL